MSKLIDWYLVELRLRLDGKLPSEVVETIIREAESHLGESVERQVGLNVDQESAEKSAIQAYGGPEKVAIAHLRKTSQLLWGIKPRWVAIFGSLVAIACWNFHWLTLSMFFDNFGEAWQNELAGVIGVCGLALVFVSAQRAYRSNRWFLAASTVIAAAATIPIVSYWMIGELGAPFYEGVSRFHLGRDVPNLEHTISKLDANNAFVERGIAVYQHATSEANLPEDLTFARVAARELEEEEFTPAVVGRGMSRGGNFVVPRRYGVFAMVDGSVWVLGTVAHFEDARKEWLNQGPKDLAEIDVLRKGMASLLASTKEAQNGKLFFLNPALYSETFIGTLVLLPGLLLVDWLGVLIPRARRRWPGKVLA